MKIQRPHHWTIAVYRRRLRREAHLRHCHGLRLNQPLGRHRPVPSPLRMRGVEPRPHRWQRCVHTVDTSRAHRAPKRNLTSPSRVLDGSPQQRPGRHHMCVRGTSTPTHRHTDTPTPRQRRDSNAQGLTDPTVFRTATPTTGDNAAHTSHHTATQHNTPYIPGGQPESNERRRSWKPLFCH